MRKIAMMFAALTLSYATGAMAQPNGNSAPQPGLPPGADIGAPNAQPPGASGDVATTRVGPSGSTASMHVSRGTDRARRAARRQRRAARHHHAAPVAPAATDAAPAAQ